MNNQKAISALNELKMYASSRSLAAINYAVEVLEKLEEAGIEKPLESLTPKGK
ncbi:MAG: hypothetical protein SOZ02_10920 [Hallerella porci]|uniref:Uncharacterized protein n=1 Tax=Hallerella porci TaxID=1945871 RepID=A0ABX5LL27_9BACT|nr:MULTISPECIES: hypothetical protein [Hallerella]MCI5601218.1 hypothetical protein [Hallerella sp.]MDY3922655.1 hypothetical protein [Hallerella porci]PWL01984.1 hypothetical protein B0H50_10973 [Hallerella porci]